MNPDLLEYLETQEATFGPDRVWTYKASERRPAMGASRTLRAFCLALIAAGVVWLGFGISREMSAWTGWGVLLLAFGLIFFLASFAQTVPVQRGLRNWKKSSLVISPGGIGMVQGDVQGIVTWQELLDVKMNVRVGNFRLSTGAIPLGILLRVQGGEYRDRRPVRPPAVGHP